jgi:lipid A 3-O-deacylase PagL
VNSFRPVIAALASLSASPAALAIDGVSFDYGLSDSSNLSVNLYLVGVQWDWNKKLIGAGNWHLGGYWDLNLGYRYQHLSNAGIKQPNQGITFNQVRFQYHF